MTERGPDLQLFHASPGWTFPELPGRAVPEGARVDLSTEDTEWSVHDTVDGDLERFGAWLARSTAGQWRLRLDGQVHTAAAVGRGVPPEFRDLLLGVRAGAALRPVQRVASERVARVVVDADGLVLGQIDDVSRQLLDSTDGAAELPHLVELIAVDGSFGDAVAKRLRKSGARPGAAPNEQATKLGSPATVRDAVRAFVSAQCAAILSGDVRLRQGADVVHPTRVAIRRIRSVLRIVDVFETDRAEALDAELRWMSGLLGEVRDLDVLSGHLAKSLDQLEGADEEQLPLAVTRAAVEAALERHSQTAQEALRTAMRGRRYLGLLRALREWAAAPPIADGADGPVGRLTEYAAAGRKKMKKQLSKAVDIESTHHARRTAKRARYVAEFVADAVPAARAKLSDQAKAAQRLQDSLGKKQDAAMAADFLSTLVHKPVGRTATRAMAADELEPAAAFGVGVLWVLERRRTA